jgi:hypothetical protein
MQHLHYTIPSTLAAVVFLIAGWVINQKSNLLKNKRLVIILFIFLLLLSSLSLFFYNYFIQPSTMVFAGLSLVALLLGFLADYLWNRNNEIANREDAIDWSGIVFLTGIVLLGMSVFSYIYTRINHSNLGQMLSLSFITFLLPQYFRTVYKAYLSIPNDIYFVWHYPYPEPELNLQHINMKECYTLRIEYTRTYEESYSRTAGTAPLDMIFGDWFYIFIKEYNSSPRNTGMPIEYMTPDSMRQGWVFYERGFLGSLRYIDPMKTIRENKLTDKKVLIAKRVNKQGR